MERTTRTSFAAFNPHGSAARERARICAFTFDPPGQHSYPTDAGLRVIADAVWKAAGY